MPQQAALYRRLTVAENLRLFARLERVADVEATVEEMLEATALGERRDEQVARLSGGNQQRINIAIGLLARPAVLLLDEPSAGLDPRQRDRLWEFVSGLAGGGTTVIFSTHNIQEAERYAGRLLVLADGERLFDGTPGRAAGARRAGGRPRDRPRLRGRLRHLPPPPGPLSGRMRWLLIKDFQILRRSPLVTALLVIYPAVIAVLIGFAISRGPEKPRIAFLSQVPAGQQLTIGSQNFDVGSARSELFSRLDVVHVSSRERRPTRLVRDGDVLGALILPPDLITKLRSAGLQQPIVQVIVNQEDPVKERLVDDRIRGLLTEANLRLSHEFSNVTLDYLGLLLRGGTFHIFGQSLDVLGLKQTERILTAVQHDLGPADPNRLALGQVISFSNLASQNLSLADSLLASVSEPIKVHKTVVTGKTAALDSFAIAVAATLTLMFVTVLLVAGSLALEREENAFARLTRGLVRPEALLAEKVALGVIVSLGVTLLMLGQCSRSSCPCTGAARRSSSPASSPAAPASPPWAPRSARPPARSAPALCSPSWSPCQSPCSR